MTEYYYCNKAEFARITGDSVRTITRYITEGMPVSSAGKKGQPLRINTVHALEWWRQKKNDVEGVISSPTGDELDLENNNARNLVYIEQHRKLKLENDRTEAELIPSGQVDYVFASAIAMLASVLDGISGRAAGGDAILRQKILDECRRAREEFANALGDLISTDDNSCSDSDEATTQEGSLEMGER